MKKQEKPLFVKATQLGCVLPIGGTNIGPLQFIGKVFNQETKKFDVIEEGVTINFHREYIDYLKKGSLLALDLETAKRAGVTPYLQDNKINLIAEGNN
jgi:hypothetical protein